MPVRNPEKWWKQTRSFAWLAAAVILTATAAAAAIGDSAGGWVISGLPVIAFIGSTAVPFILSGAVFWIALRQEKTDRQYSVWESR